MNHHHNNQTHVTLKIFYFAVTFGVLVMLPVVVFTLVTANTKIIPALKSYVVLSGSMEPTIPVGSITYTRKSAEYITGDIIAFQNAAGQTVTHRVHRMKVGKTGPAYETKGDANETTDQEVIPADKVLGKVVMHVPSIGFVVNYLKTPQGFIAFIVVPTILFIFFELWNIKNEFVRQAERRLIERLQIHE